MYYFLGILAILCVLALFAFLAIKVRDLLLKKRQLAFKQLEPHRFYIPFRKLPFKLDEKQIIYIENEFDEKANAFIGRNHKRITRYFKSRGYSFCYMPKLATQFNDEVYKYHRPTYHNGCATSVGSSYLLDYMSHPQDRANIAPSLLYCRRGIPKEVGGYTAMCALPLGDFSQIDNKLKRLFKFIIDDRKPYERKKHEPIIPKPEPFDSEQEQDIWGQDIKPMPSFGFPPFGLDESGSCSYSLNLDRVRPRYEADDWFDDEAEQLVEEVAERVEKLQQKGLSRYLLEQVIFGPSKLSRLVVTHDYRILLPDYNNMEIEMTPLVKAVFILFLSHPEGIAFKSLPDYREELLCTYMSIRGLKESTEEIRKSINAATDPFNNSINEKCARIREAFVEQFDENIAKNYFVTGKRGEPKAITLSRDLVVWE